MNTPQQCTTLHLADNDRINDHEGDELNNDNNWHYMSVETVVERLKTSTQEGLTSQEVNQRLEQNGKNTLDTGKSIIPLWMKLIWRHSINVMNFVLLTAAILSIVVKDYVDFGVILAIIVINIIIGFLQEYKSETTMNQLKKLTAPVSTVMRDGKKQEILSADIVVGDIVYLKEGSQIPADLRMFHTVNLECHEALLTGEPIPIPKISEALERKHKTRVSFSDSVRPTIQVDDALSKKTVAVGDRINCAFMSTTVTKGKGTGIVVETGIQTEIGKIAKSLSQASSQSTPLQKRLNYMGITLMMIVAVIALGIVLLSVGQHKGKKTLFPDALIIGVTIGVAVIPESLVAVITLAMAIGVRAMVKQNAIVRKLAALETLGAITDICTDKTGTLTEGKMIATTMWLNGIKYNVNTVMESGKIEGKILNSTGGEPITHQNMPGNMNMLLSVASMCNSSSISYIVPDDISKEKKKKTNDLGLTMVGDPTELALNILSHVAGMNKTHLEETSYSRVAAEHPFDSTVKRMTMIYETKESGVYHVLTKGAPDNVLSLCNSYLKENLVEEELTPDYDSTIRKANDEIAQKGLRVLSLAYKKITGDDPAILKREDIEKDLVFIGLVGIQDPPRQEVPDAIQTCVNAGIVVHMLTGDHYITAKAISEQVGIMDKSNADPNAVMKATQFDEYTDDQLKELKELPLVIARCSPQSKVKMVKALHSRKRLVAMTGDGVNDAPSIKIADIGIAMGKNGSDVTKEAADIILTDDNFATIVLAIKEGRRIFANIRKFVIHLLSANVAQLFVLLIPVVAGFEVPLNPTQILWLNLVTGTPPAISLSVEKASKKIMHKRRKQSLFNWETLSDIIFYGSSMAVISLLSFFCMTNLWLKRELIAAQAVTFTSLTYMLLFHAYNCRHVHKPFYRDQVWKSYWLHLSVLLGVGLQCFTLYTPWINNVLFAQKGLRGDEWAFIVVGCAAFMASAEVYKLCKRIMKKSLRWTWNRIRTRSPEVELQSIVIHGAPVTSPLKQNQPGEELSAS
jgi:Na+-exporting ATPase